MLEYYWHKETEQMTSEDFRRTIVEVSTLQEGKIFSSLKLLLDNRDFLFGISPDDQEWHASYTEPKLKAIVEDITSIKTAYVVSRDFISQLSIEQTAEENVTMDVSDIKYFDSLEKARDWLLDE